MKKWTMLQKNNSQVYLIPAFLIEPTDIHICYICYLLTALSVPFEVISVMQILPLGIGTHLPIILAFVPSSMKQYCPDMPYLRVITLKQTAFLLDRSFLFGVFVLQLLF